MTSPFLPAAFHDARLVDAPEADRDGCALPGGEGTTGFVAGTRIATPMGYVAAERLSVGDRVLTSDGRHVRLAWTGCLRVALTPRTAPVRIEVGALGNMRPLRLGQGQRLREAVSRKGFDGTDGKLITARCLLDAGRAMLDDALAAEVTYVQLMFERPEIVLAENVACEALVHDPDAVRQTGETARLAA